MKLFHNMTKEDAKELYNKIKIEKMDINFKNNLLNDLLFFTNNFTKDY